MPDMAQPAFYDKKPRIAGAFVVDAFTRQLKELFFIDTPALIGTDKERAFTSVEFAQYAASKEETALWVHYPWNNHLVKTAGPDEYVRLITNRNQDLITAAEQKALYEFPVAVLGMSVGSNIAFLLAQAGISRRMVLADFDELDTTNLNRIFAGVHQIGLNKTVVAARRIYENNPFTEVTMLQRGMNEENLEALLKEGAVRCIVEEIDDIAFKIKVRQLAIRYKVPVVMVTDNGDGAVLHVERYDLGHELIWGKPASHFGALLAGKLTKEAAGKIIMNDIVGGADRVDPRMLASVGRVFARELVSWSQLGSAAMLGAVAAVHAIKRIALGLDREMDVRAYIHPGTFPRSTHSV